MRNPFEYGGVVSGEFIDLELVEQARLWPEDLLLVSPSYRLKPALCNPLSIHFCSPPKELPTNPLLRQAVPSGKKLTRLFSTGFQPVAEC